MVRQFALTMTDIIRFVAIALAVSFESSLQDSAFAQEEPPAGTVNVAGETSEADFQKVFDEYYEQYVTLFPLEATGFGDNRYNDLLTLDIAEDFAEKEKAFYLSTLKKLESIDTEKASSFNRIAARVLKYELMMRLQSFEFDVDRIPFHQFDGLPLAFAQLGSGTGNQPFRSVRDYENWLARVSQFPVWSRIAINRFRQGSSEGYVLPKILVMRMIDQLEAPSIVANEIEASIYFKPVASFPTNINNVERDRLRELFRTAIELQIIPAYQSLSQFLRDEYLPKSRNSVGLSELPNGDSQYRYWVRRWTTTELTPEQVYEIGESETARIRAEMEKVREDMHYAGTLSEFFDFLRSDPQFKPFKSANDVLDFFRAMQSKLEPRLDQMFLTKPKTPFEIRRTESFREITASAEYMPGTADGTRPGIFYCPIPDATQYNITSGMESLFLHEALPGHHYQVSLQQENQSMPKFARFLWYGAFGEGWALYCESLGEELGMYSDPRQRIGALGDEMHRAIRLVVDVGLHAKGWTREQAISYMMSNEPISEQSAVAEVERYMAYPGQALSYKIGQLEIRKLRTQLERKLGSQFSLPEFHEAVLRHGCVPLSLLEEELK